jgi:bifunctional non-homologous end joining protein LigD
MHVRRATVAERLTATVPATYMVFDVLRLDGEDLTGRPLSVRRTALESLGLAGPHVQVPTAYDDGVSLLAATEQQGLEGVVSKKLSSVYLPGRRSPDWLKFPNRPTESYVVGGWRYETDSDHRLGAVLVGLPGPDGLRYRGRVGSGIAGRRGQQLREVLDPLHADTSPFADVVPRVDAVGTVWVRPELVVEVASLGTTPAGRLRQPSYRGVRPDLDPTDLTSEG